MPGIKGNKKAMHPNSLANLRPPIQPGERLPGAGRPRTKHITDAYERQLLTPLPEDLRRSLKLPKGALYLHAVAQRQVEMAIKGETPAAKEIADRLEGKSVARLEHTGRDGAAIEIDSAVDLEAMRANLLDKFTTRG